MKKDVITLEKITYKNYVKVLFGLNVNRKQKEFVASNEKAGKRPMASVIVLIFEKIAVALFLYKNLTERRCSL